MLDLLADLDDPRFSGMRIHEAFEDLAALGIHVQRYVRTPEPSLSWIDAEFGSWWSSHALVGSSYIAHDAEGPVGFATFDPRGAEFSWSRTWASRDDVGVVACFGVALRARKNGLGLALLHGALFSLRERGYAYALLPSVSNERLASYLRQHGNARTVQAVQPSSTQRRPRAVVLASGNGTNFQAVIDAVGERRIPLELVSLVVNRADAYAIQRAAAAGIAVRTLVWNQSETTRAVFDAALLDAVAALTPDLVLLLGWMHILPDAFLERFPQIVNVHPAFLPLDPALDSVTMPDGEVIPALRGVRAFDDALARGLRWYGASMHRAGFEVDRGAVLVRAPLLRKTDEPREALFERIQAIEHRLVVTGIRRWIGESWGMQMEDSDSR